MAHRFILGLLIAATLAGCNDGSNGNSTANGAPSSTVAPPSTVSASSATISGKPVASVVAGNAYSFTPTSTNPSGGVLTFTIQNAPSWATFNATTGELSGTPTVGDVGTDSNIVITVNDGMASSSLSAFSIAVTQSASGTATLQWVPPTENTNGTALTDLAGYTIYYGNSPDAVTQSVQIANPGIATYMVTNLSPGTWYFSIS